MQSFLFLIYVKPLLVGNTTPEIFVVLSRLVDTLLESRFNKLLSFSWDNTGTGRFLRDGRLLRLSNEGKGKKLSGSGNSDRSCLIRLVGFRDLVYDVNIWIICLVRSTG